MPIAKRLAGRRMLLMLFLALVAFFVSTVAVVPARADTPADNLQILGKVDTDGTMHVTQTLTFAGRAPKISQRIENSTPALDYANYEFEIFDISANADGTDLGAAVRQEGNYTIIEVDGSKAGGRPVTINYSVRGAALAGQPDQDGAALTEIKWRVVQGLNIAVNEVSGEINIGSALAQDVDCVAGPPTSALGCATLAAATFDSTSPTFTNGPLGAGEIVQVSIKVDDNDIAPNQVIHEQWTLDRAFSAEPLYLLTALGTLILGAILLYALYRIRGRDVNVTIEPINVASFEPSGDGEMRFQINSKVRPGQIGTLVDETVDPIDVTATILDLAGRGHLVIHQLPRETDNSAMDWKLERGESKDELAEFERRLLDAIAPEGQAPLKVSTLSTAVSESIAGVQDAIYDDVVERGWFAFRPDEIRHVWSRLGIIATIIALIVLIGLTAFTHFALTGLALVGLAVGLLFVAQEMPRRSEKGAAILNGLELLAMQLRAQATDLIPKRSAYEQITMILPYAVVLGSANRWVQALADADNDPGVPDPQDLSWYQAPENWQLKDLPVCLDQFITTVEGKLYSRG